MEIKILNSILHKELRPWIMDTGHKNIAEKLRNTGSKEPKYLDDLKQQIKILVEDYPELSKWLDKQKHNSASSITPLYFSTDLPDFKDVITKYYTLLISKEILRVFNAFLLKSDNWNSKVEIIYNTNILLKNIKALTKQVFNEILERGFEEEDIENNLSNFVLLYLKHSLITLYFSVQEVHKEVLEQVISVEDFYLLELGLSLSDIKEINFLGKASDTIQTKTDKKKLNFGFNGDIEKLKSALSRLDKLTDLIDGDTTSLNDLFNILTSKEIKPKSIKIRLNCETAIFRYIIDKLKPVFSNLKPISIEKTESFYSKNGVLITAQNLYSSKIENPKLKEDIDKIFKHLQ